MQWQREPATLKIANGRPRGWLMFLYIKKSERIEAFSGRKASGFIHVECFDTRIGNSALWLRSSVRQNVGLQNQMSEVQILSGSPGIWGCSSVGRAFALQARCRRSDPCHLHHIRRARSIGDFRRL